MHHDQLSLLASLIVAASADVQGTDYGYVSGDKALFTKYPLAEMPGAAGCKFFLHQLHRSDPDDLHCHPWDNVSVVLTGGYREITREGTFVRRPGDIVERLATEPHRIELL